MGEEKKKQRAFSSELNKKTNSRAYLTFFLFQLTPSKINSFLTLYILACNLVESNSWYSGHESQTALSSYLSGSNPLSRKSYWTIEATRLSKFRLLSRFRVNVDTVHPTKEVDWFEILAVLVCKKKRQMRKNHLKNRTLNITIKYTWVVMNSSYWNLTPWSMYRSQTSSLKIQIILY